MKISDGFDARRLRPQEPKSWRLRFCAALGALFALVGLLLGALGAISLAGGAEALGGLGSGRDGALVLLAGGVLLLWFGLFLWRRCRRRGRQPNGLSLSPHLMRKRG
ncbi:hypothetical protein [Stutzerimonas azotifigens]|uniref:hypothetical protein n=1 Tax=Stutzerimonas azotifigens TaxID=291995 RepID=UPI0004151E5B|nr:hypothetical protein [Stutzerimonas azotifigens]